MAVGRIVVGTGFLDVFRYPSAPGRSGQSSTEYQGFWVEVFDFASINQMHFGTLAAHSL